MCLHATHQRIAGDITPNRRTAYKIVRKGTRQPLHFPETKVRYFDGSRHSVARGAVMEARRGSRLYFRGFHVYLQKETAHDRCMDDESVIEVEVSPARWVADGTNASGMFPQAVYTGLKVIGRVRKP